MTALLVSQIRDCLEWRDGPLAPNRRVQVIAGRSDDFWNALQLLFASDHETECARCKEHEMFRHQHRDCDSLAVTIQALRLGLREIAETDPAYGREMRMDAERLLRESDPMRPAVKTA